MHSVKQPSSYDAFFRGPEFKKHEPFPSGIFSDSQEAPQLTHAAAAAAAAPSNAM
jgi:hypothetical protein